jgi:hypothetical protein
VVLPIPSFMKAYIVGIEGHGLIGGDSAIDPEEEEADAYSSGTGKFDLEKRPGRVMGRRVMPRTVASMADTHAHTHGYGGIGALVSHPSWFSSCHQ